MDNYTVGELNRIPEYHPYKTDGWPSPKPKAPTK